MARPEAKPYMVLNDGTTYTSIIGCQIKYLTEDEENRVADGECSISDVGEVAFEAVPPKSDDYLADYYGAWYWEHMR